MPKIRAIIILLIVVSGVNTNAQNNLMGVEKIGVYSLENHNSIGGGLEYTKVLKFKREFGFSADYQKMEEQIQSSDIITGRIRYGINLVKFGIKTNLWLKGGPEVGYQRFYSKETKNELWCFFAGGVVGMELEYMGENLMIFIGANQEGHVLANSFRANYNITLGIRTKL